MSGLVRLVDGLIAYQHDPLGLVQVSYPWGVSHTPLEAYQGPRAWQVELLAELGDRLRAGYEPGAVMMPVLKAVASGHGPGKSALLAWLVWWSLTTMADARVVVTANTRPQLVTKTWPEIAKWARLALNSSWFEVQGMSVLSRAPGHDKTWRADAVTWSVDNLDAFAGLHNLGRRVTLLFDEAAGIDDKVWEVSEGALTDVDTEVLWVAMGNPTRPNGRFHRCFGAERERWRGIHLDSRKVEGTNKALFDEWVRLYGEDSDFVRVRVRGVFPRSAANAFIAPDVVEEAARREAVQHLTDPFVLGVDIARFGNAMTVLYPRKGRDARTMAPIKLRGVDTMQVAARVADLHRECRFDGIFVDGGGVGGGVVDRLRQLRVPVVEVQFGGKSDRVSFTEETAVYANKRAEMWGNMRDWLKSGAIPDDIDLRAQLEGPLYQFVVRDGRDAIQLESKDAMEGRGLESPDIADALALTFAYPVEPSINSGRPGAGLRPMVQTEYDPLRALDAILARGSGMTSEYNPLESME